MIEQTHKRCPHRQHEQQRHCPPRFERTQHPSSYPPPNNIPHDNNQGPFLCAKGGGAPCTLLHEPKRKCDEKKAPALTLGRAALTTPPRPPVGDGDREEDDGSGISAASSSVALLECLEEGRATGDVGRGADTSPGPGSCSAVGGARPPGLGAPGCAAVSREPRRPGVRGDWSLGPVRDASKVHAAYFLRRQLLPSNLPP